MPHAALPLAGTQEGVWLEQLLTPDTPCFNLGGWTRFDGAVRFELLERAVAEVMRRHDALRLVLEPGDKVPFQRALPPEPVAVEQLDFSALPDADDRARAYMRQAIRAPHVLYGHRLWQAQWLRVSAVRSYCVYRFHHLAFDGASTIIVANAVLEAYRRLQRGEPAPDADAASFIDFVAGDLAARSSPRYHADREFWLQRYRDPVPPLFEQAQRGLGRSAAQQKLWRVPRIDYDRMVSAAARLGGSITHALTLALASCLARLSGGRAEVSVGLAIHNRGPAEKRMVGMLSQQLPLRVALGPAETLRSALAALVTQTRAAYRHRSFPQHELARLVHKGAQRTRLFDVAVSVEPYSMDFVLDGIDVHTQALYNGHESAAVAVYVREYSDVEDVEVELNFDPLVLSDEQAARAIAALERILRQALQTPDARLACLPLMDPDERERIVHGFNATAAPAPEERNLYELFARQALRTPDAPALSFDDETLSYAQLERRVDWLARHLRQMGVRPDAAVAVCLPRSVEMVVAILAALRAGGACVPLDPDYPEERLRWMLRDSRPCVLLTEAGQLDTLAPPPSVDVLLVDALRSGSFMPFAEAATGPEPGPLHVAYVMYTSGSTGRPKGLALQHAALLNLFEWDRRHAPLRAPARTLQFSALSFDAAFYEIFSAFSSGGSLVLLHSRVRQDPHELVRLMRRQRVQRIDLPAVALHAMAAASLDLGEVLPDLVDVITAGEQLNITPAVRAFFESHPQRRLHNHYGPTETHVVTAHTLSPEASAWPNQPPIGQPLINTRIYILGPGGEPVPVAVVGEIFIGGVQVGRGYLHRPDLTAERFVPDPFAAAAGAPGARMYRSGDVGRWTADGCIEFLGRNDEQVKIRGYRVEPGEVEAVLQRCPGVREAVVQAREDMPGHKRLVAYVTGADRLLPEDLRSRLAAELPDYMVPAAYVQLPALPSTPSGKLDRRALPAPADDAFVAQPYQAPAGDIEGTLADIWTAVLKIERVGRDDDFFELGGNSLLAVQIVSRIRARLGGTIRVADVFTHSTLREQAAFVANALAGELQPIVPVTRTGMLPMSFAQQRLWFICQFDDRASRAYHLAIHLRLRGDLDRTALQEALDALLARHEPLRTALLPTETGAVQCIAPAGAPLPLREEDLRDLAHAERASRLSLLVGEELRTPFDLRQGGLVRTRLVRSSDREFDLLITLHHVVADGWSLGVLTRELGVLYSAFISGRHDPLPALPVQYADFAVWQRSQQGGDALQRQLNFWRDQLAGAPARLELPTDRARPAVQHYGGAWQDIELPPSLSTALRGLAQRHGCTLFMTLLAGWAVVLARLSGQDDVVIGTPVANRNRVELEPLVGLFANTQALRVRSPARQTVGALLEHARTTTLAAHDHQDLPFEQVIAAVNPPRSLAHHPIFQVMFAWQDAPQPAPVLPGLEARLVDPDSLSAQFDLELMLLDDGERITGRLVYATALFDAATAARHVACLSSVLAAMAADDRQAVRHLPLLQPQEQTRMLLDFNPAPAASQAPRLAHLDFEHQAALTPDATALRAERGTLSYAELNAQANRLARELRVLGVGPDSRVVVLAPRGAATVLALLATLKAGGCHVPLDPGYPAERLSFILSDCAADVVITDLAHAADLPAGLHAEVLLLDAPSPRWQIRASANLGDAAPALGPDHAAYIIYTSGSTGRPKGVLVTHGNLASYLHHGGRAYGIRACDRVLHASSIGFDMAIEETLLALSAGAALAVLPTPSLPAIGEFTAFLHEQQVSLMVLPTAYWHEWAAAVALGEAAVPACVRTVLVGGEQAAHERCVEWHAHVGDRVRWVNTYGPTETTVIVTTGPFVARGGAPDIGRPVDATRIYVLDDRGQPVPVGVAGHLHIAGAQVARGYWRRPDLTAESFVPDPFATTPGARMYRSGDLARWNADGTLQFLGRRDQQVKLRGFRIEPGEIETALARVPGVRDVAVLAREDEPGRQRLVAYLTGPRVPAPEALRSTLARVLPDHMVPAAYVRLESLPLTPNGKLDRQALPAPEGSAFGAVLFEPPQGPLECALATLWGELLGHPQVGRQDSFFELGGHSLLAVQLASRVRSRLGVEVALAQLFAQPRLAGFAQAVAAASASTLPAIVPADRSVPIPLSFAQQRLWFLDRLDERAGAAYHVPGGVRLLGALNTAALQAALDRLVARHEALRTSFEPAGDGAVQRVAAAGIGLPLHPLDLSALAEPQRQQRWQHVAAQEARAPFNLAQGPLIRAKLLKLSDTDHVLLVTMHHIVSDGWSMGVLVNEVSTLYAACVAGRPDPLPALPIQYADFAVWQRRWLEGPVLQRQLQFWTGYLHDAPALLELPTDRPRPPVQDFAGDVVHFEVDSELTTQLKELAQRHGATLFMVMLAAWGTLLARLSGQHDVVIGVPVSNRNRAEIEPLIGFFVNTLALRVGLSSSTAVAQLLAQVRDATLAAQDHQDIPFEQVIEALKPERSLAHHPVYQVTFTWQNAPEGRLHLPGLELEAIASPSYEAKFDAELIMQEDGGRMHGSLVYATALFDRATIERHVAHFATLMRAMAADEHSPAARIALLQPAEREQLVRHVNARHASCAGGPLIHEAIRLQAQRAPEATAVVCHGSTVSYGELEQRARRLARQLAASGVRPEARVVICLPRGVEMIVALLATLQAGGTYVPLDPAYPAERQAFMLEDSRPRVVLTLSGLADVLPATRALQRARVLLLDQDLP
ncbi:MAG TPA: amino acid adenylation domain-containing protein, partial [Burkholderiaceae bacterium]|nr:amino acid adenylation domain-containing protein [Burkholderiaceae bacterium]